MARKRARRVEQERAESLVLAARREGREPEAAREAEADRVLAHVVGVARGVEEVGATLAFTFWVDQGALTLMGYREEGSGGHAGRRVESEGLARVLRHVFTDYVGRRTGEVVLKLRREEARWAVEHDATRQASRPPEAQTLPVRIRGIPADTFLAFHEAVRKGLHAVQVPAGGSTRVEFVARLEDGRLVGWELLEVRRTREGVGGNPRPLSPGVAGHRTERETLRGLFVRLEQVIQQPLDADTKNALRGAARKYYAELYPQFAELVGGQGSRFPIHHRRPLQYAHLFPAEDINAGENLAVLQRYVHNEINFLWGRFRQARANPTADEVRRAAEIIDRHFESWYHRVNDPPGLSKTTGEAREAALRELQGQFPGLD